MEQLLITDAEVKKIMIDGGKRLCDYAIEQWVSGKYSTGGKFIQKEWNYRQLNIQRWKEIKNRINEEMFGESK